MSGKKCLSFLKSQAFMCKLNMMLGRELKFTLCA